MKSHVIIVLLSALSSFNLYAQEIVLPVNYNPLFKKQPIHPFFKNTTSLSLPFFEDFTGNSALPDYTKWTDYSVYINNTMALNSVSRGVATFDALDNHGMPYDSNSFVYRYADSLTSQPIDLSIYTPGDSIYLSFFYQPQGRGFSPETQDSLILFLKKSNGSWARMWSKEGTTVQPFRQVMIPVTDTAFFKADFQFRFVNKASINLNDDVWNIDYIRLAANRNINDTVINDLVTTEQPGNLLNDYTAMPYRHFKANPNAEIAAQHSFTTANHYNNQVSVVYGYTAREQTSNTALSSSTGNDNISSYTSKQYQFSNYGSGFNAANPYDKVVYENKYYVSQPSGTDPKENDTIIHEQVFDNYLAYDDGTAEKAYYLQQSSWGLPAKMAIEFHLNQPDTLQGVAICFGKQPLAFNKFFSLAVYKNITLGSLFDTALYQQDLNFPGYVDTMNHFWVYKLDNPVPLNAGTFFLGTIQPAFSGSDSLAFGLDVNRLGGNHRYINVNGFWESSALAGAVMIRPLLGKPVFSTDVATPSKRQENDWLIYPNPAQNTINIKTQGTHPYVYEIMDAQGRVLKKNLNSSSAVIDVSDLSSGIYFVRILDSRGLSAPKKFIKI